MRGRVWAFVLLTLFGLGGSFAMEPTKEHLTEDFDATWAEGRWSFWNGAEFPGAKGSFERAKDAAHAGELGGKPSFDFTGGGNYVAAHLKLKDAPDIKGVKLWLKNPSGNRITKELDLGAAVIAFRFAAPGKPAVTALWSVSGDKTVAVPATKPLTLIGLMGDTESLPVADGQVKVPLRNEVPVFLRE